MRLKKGCRDWAIVLPVFAVDRICKAAAIHFFAPNGVQIAVPGVFSWAFCKNTGAAFSMMSEHPAVMFVATSLLIIALLIILLRCPQLPALTRIGLWMVAGGGMSNLFDRIFYGAVIDFIRPDFIRFATFNPADVFVCTGAALAAISIFASHGKEAL